ncbi:MAG: hypothetical protein RLZZ214_2469 [Verrucomicrobiota bacterium]|jgi:hypothetical protein
MIAVSFDAPAPVPGHSFFPDKNPPAGDRQNSGISCGHGVIVLFRGGLNDGDFITLSNSGNSWDGETRIFAGNNGTGAGLKLGIDNGLPATTTIVAGGNSSSTGNMFDLNGFDPTLSGLTNRNGALHIVNNGASSSTLTLNPTVDRDDSTILATMTAIDNTESVGVVAGAAFDVSAQTGYVMPSGKTFTLKLGGAAAGTAGKIKATGLDVGNATVTLDPVTTLDDVVFILAAHTAA